MKLKQKNVLVYGLGKSGLAASNLLNQKGANVFLYDDDKLSLKSLEKSKFLNFSYDIIFNLTDEVLSFIDLVILNPAVSVYHENIVKIKEKNIKVISELELAYAFKKGKIIAVTGTNGKTTTVELIDHIFKSAQIESVKTGNIGTPFSDTVLEHKNKTFITEVSSFQLETIEYFKPKIACFLNLTQDHLNRHFTMGKYKNEKTKLFMNMKKSDYAVLNADDIEVISILPLLRTKIYTYSTKKEVEKGVFVEGENIVFKNKKQKQVLFSKNIITLLGEHNLSNILCCTLVGILSKIKLDDIITAVKSFKLSNHRLQFVATKNGVDFYDDSKATNIDACLKAINSFTKNIVLMLGGSDKGEHYDELFEHLTKNVVHIVVSGDNKEKILESAKKYKYKNIVEAKNFNDCFLKAKELVKQGEIVLLAPASASFDEFKNYAERGDTFIKLVQAL